MSDSEEPIEFSLPPELGDLAGTGPPLCNRIPGRSAAEANLNGAPHGFRATGDAAWDRDSDDYAMFSEAGNREVAAMVRTARLKVKSEPEAAVLSWLTAENARLRGDTGEYPYLPQHQSGGGTRTKRGHEEVTDTMVRETIAYALDEAWQEAYGHKFGEE